MSTPPFFFLFFSDALTFDHVTYRFGLSSFAEGERLLDDYTLNRRFLFV
jgi:hypothetical protein